MSFDVFLEFLDEGGLAKDDVRRMCPVIRSGGQPDMWVLQHGESECCVVYLTPVAGEADKLESMCVNRPCGEVYADLLKILRMGMVVMYWPGGPPLMSSRDKVERLPDGLASALGEPRVVDSVEDVLRILRET